MTQGLRRNACARAVRSIVVLLSMATTGLAASPPPVVEPPPPDSNDATPVASPPQAEPAPTEVAPSPPATDEPTPATQPAAEPSPLDRVRKALAMERFGTAVVLCEEMDVRTRVEDASLDQATRTSCGAAYLSLGDKLAAMGSMSGARKRWEQAAEVDPRLLDDAAFSKRMMSGETPTSPKPTVTPAPAATQTPATGSWVSRRTPARPTTQRPKSKPKPRAKPRQRERPDDAGPRYDWGLGVGVGAGFDGVASLILSWMTDETIALELSIGVIYPVADTRVRWYGIRGALTPVLGFGMTTPFGSTDRFGLNAAGFNALYELGESFHIDIGVAWTFAEHVDVFAGLAFVTPFDQDNPDTVVLFPQAALQLSWYF